MAPSAEWRRLVVTALQIMEHIGIVADLRLLEDIATISVPLFLSLCLTEAV